MTDTERLKKLQAKIAKKTEMETAKKAVETARANLKKLRSK